MTNPTPIYTEALREAKRRTRKGSPERALLLEMDERTTPPAGRATGPSVRFAPIGFTDDGGLRTELRPYAAGGLVQEFLR